MSDDMTIEERHLVRYAEEIIEKHGEDFFLSVCDEADPWWHAFADVVRARAEYRMVRLWKRVLQGRSVTFFSKDGYPINSIEPRS